MKTMHSIFAASIFAGFTVLLTGCAVVPLGKFNRACYLLDVALMEAQMAPGWHIEAGEVLEACGDKDAPGRAAYMACIASRINDNTVDCSTEP